MTEPDLRGCADEPIRIPGAVQPHGALLALSEPDLAVVVASANAADLLGGGRTADDLLGPDVAHQLRTEDLAVLNPLRTTVRGREVDLVAHRADGLLVVEVEPLEQAHRSDAVWHRRLPVVLQRLQAAPSLDVLTDVLATEVRALTGFDRVMVYRFDPHWNGEVVAEDRREDLEPFLGLRYPASDIPRAGARAVPPQLAAAHPRRDLRAGAARAGAGRRPAARPRRLRSCAACRRCTSSTSRTWAYGASMSVSLDRRRAAVGPHRLPPLRRAAPPQRPPTAPRRSSSVGPRRSCWPARPRRAARRACWRWPSSRRGWWRRSPRTPRDPAGALAAGLLDLLPAGGAALRFGGRLHLLGETPPGAAELVEKLLHAGVPATDEVLTVVPDAPDAVPLASGVLAVPVGRDGDLLAWFRPETLRDVDWGGDPHTSKVVEGDYGPRLSPRLSFARWTETVRGTSAPWQPHELAAAQQLAVHLADVTRRRAEEESRLAATLQRTLLLEQLPEVPGVALAARYAPSARDVVGGDWYDLVLLPNGRVSVVLGDVAGHGLGAAAITAQLRHALRAYLLACDGPAAALTRLNALAAFLLPDELATVIVAELDPAYRRAARRQRGPPAGAGARTTTVVTSSVRGAVRRSA